jgi:hypothetical protein
VQSGRYEELSMQPHRMLLNTFLRGRYSPPGRLGGQWHEGALFFVQCGIRTVKRGLRPGLGFCVVRPRIFHEIHASNSAWCVRAKTSRECGFVGWVPVVVRTRRVVFEHWS